MDWARRRVLLKAKSGGGKKEICGSQLHILCSVLTLGFTVTLIDFVLYEGYTGRCLKMKDINDHENETTPEEDVFVYIAFRGSAEEKQLRIGTAGSRNYGRIDSRNSGMF
jgi:hypothetical protein